ncbi:MAG: hypothetical protein WDA11_04025 [Thiohalomonadaceae bacterium]
MVFRSLDSRELRDVTGGATGTLALGALGTLTIDAAMPWLGAIASTVASLLTSVAGLLGSLL